MCVHTTVKHDSLLQYSQGSELVLDSYASTLQILTKCLPSKC